LGVLRNSLAISWSYLRTQSQHVQECFVSRPLCCHSRCITNTIFHFALMISLSLSSLKDTCIHFYVSTFDFILSNVFLNDYQIYYKTLFQIFDFVGRTLPQWIIFIGKQWLWIPNLFRYHNGRTLVDLFFVLNELYHDFFSENIRCIFFGLFIMSVKQILLTSDWWPLITMIVFAFTNGYFGSTWQSSIITKTIVKRRDSIQEKNFFNSLKNEQTFTL
jgi:hypothetical protein